MVNFARNGARGDAHRPLQMLSLSKVNRVRGWKGNGEVPVLSLGGCGRLRGTTSSSKVSCCSISRSLGQGVVGCDATRRDAMLCCTRKLVIMAAGLEEQWCVLRQCRHAAECCCGGGIMALTICAPPRTVAEDTAGMYVFTVVGVGKSEGGRN